MLKSEGTENSEKKTDRIEIEYFTDPLCCWSWAFEPTWRRFVNENKHAIRWKYRMGGMISDWSNYEDPFNDISRPAQMGPLWLQVKYTTGTEINPGIWLNDPPASSLPACMAVKCAEIQSVAAADILLLLLRKAVMTEEKNIARKEVIFELAQSVQDKYHVLNFEQFKTDWNLNKPLALVKEDMQITKLNNIGRFPTITMQAANGKGIMIVGYRPYPVLLEAFQHFAESLEHEINLK
jgi:predicted DsbA family dithiol-disulfide isomerase